MVNLFQPLAAVEEFITQQKMIEAAKEFRKKEEKKVIEVIEDRDLIADKLKKSYFSGMTPFMVSSLSAYISLAEFCGIVQGKFNHLFVVDVRKLNLSAVSPSASLAPKKTNFSEEMLEVKENLARILAEGGLLIISLDESIADTAKEDAQLVSTLNSLYNPQCLPHGILSKDDLSNPSVFKKVLQGTEFEKTTTIHSNCFVMVWARIKPDTNREKQEIFEKIKRKYERVPGVSEGIEMNPLNIYIVGK